MVQGRATDAQQTAAAGNGPDLEAVRKLLEDRPGPRAGMIALLTAIQARYGYLPEEALRLVAAKTGRSLVEVFGIATFYRSFSLKPRGKHLICACQGTACHVRGAPRVVEELQRQLAIAPGQTTPDKEFTLETVNCLGACALGPVAVVDGHYVPKMKQPMVRSLLERARKGLDAADADGDGLTFPIHVSCPSCNHSLMDDGFAIDGHPSIRLSVSVGDNHGWVRLSSVYGSYNSCVECDMPAGAVGTLYCPHCHANLAGASECATCDAPMALMAVRGGATMQVCARRGCRSHMLDLG